MDKIELEKIKKNALERYIPIIMDDTLEIIEKELKNNKPNKVLEIGTAVGYSAMCFSEFLTENGKIDTIERDEERILEAHKNINKMKLKDVINQNNGDIKKAEFFLKFNKEI